MPADFSRYVNLTIHDRDPGDLYREMIEVARTVMPEFTLRRGTVEDAIFQAVAYVGTVATNSVNRLPDGLMQGLVSLLGFQRNIGTRATATATVTLYGTTGGIIPLGTEFRYRYIDTVNGTTTDYLFVASEDVVVTASATPTAVVPLTCDIFGEISAPTINTTTLLPLSVDTEINTAVFTTFTNGLPPLSDSEYLDSAKTYLESLSSTYVTSRQLESAILTTFPNVARCKVYDLTNAGQNTSLAYKPDRGVLTFIPDTAKNVDNSNYKGLMSIFVYGFSGPLTSSEKSSIQSFVANTTIAGLDIGVFDFQTTSPTLSVTAKYDAAFNSADVQESIAVVIADYLSPQYYPYEELSVSSPAIRVSSLSNRLLAAVPGLLYVDSISMTPPSALPYTNATASSGAVLFTVSSTSNLAVGQRVKVVHSKGEAYSVSSVKILSIPSATTFTAEITPTTSANKIVSSVSGSGTAVTYTTSTAHGFAAGETVTVAGITTTTAYNGTFTIAAVPTSTTFTVTSDTTGTGTTSGSSTAIVNSGNLYLQFSDTSASTSTLTFLNRGVLPDVGTANISSTITSEVV